MKIGPLTFQWACLVCVCRSMQSASRALSNSTTLARVSSARSFFVLNMTRLLSHDGSSGRCRAGLGFQKGQQVLVDLLVMGRAHAVGQTRVDLERGALNELAGKHRRAGNGDEPSLVGRRE